MLVANTNYYSVDDQRFYCVIKNKMSGEDQLLQGDDYLNFTEEIDRAPNENVINILCSEYF